MKIRVVDETAPGGAAEVEREVPDAIVATFVNRIRLNRHQWQRVPGLLERWLEEFDHDLEALPPVEPGPPVMTKRQMQTAKARAARAANRKAAA